MSITTQFCFTSGRKSRLVISLQKIFELHNLSVQKKLQEGWIELSRKKVDISPTWQIRKRLNQHSCYLKGPYLKNLQLAPIIVKKERKISTILIIVKLKAKSLAQELTWFYRCHKDKKNNPHQNLSEGGVQGCTRSLEFNT